MAEDNIDISESKEVTFTAEQQAKIDEIVSSRINAINAKHENALKDLEKKHQKEIERSKMDEADRLKAEADEQMASYKKRAEDAELKVRIGTTERELAKVGLDTSLARTLMGETDEETMSNIKSIEKVAREWANKMYADMVGKGAPPAPTGTDGGSEMLSIMRKAAGL
ncbi:MAG: DUF4355 domain-containing protein [Candidatus Methanomethylophilaceae archaeon]|nr:DUF4355 domain-containing protein [Candidatus Methanomethylophilaceae archaeon]